ncbi:MAG: hypothetical protein R2932_57745 [Caldilineaceae bacterium]
MLSFNSDSTVPGLGAVDESDIVRFIPTALGAATSGTFEMYFDGSDVGLTTNGEDLDGLALLDDGTLLISVAGSFAVDGLSGVDEDILRFTPISLGDNTSGTWSFYFDGSTVALNTASTEDITGLYSEAVNGSIFMTTLGAFSVAGVSGDGADIFICHPSTLGQNNTTCTFTMFWDGSAFGYGSESMDAFNIATNQIVSSAIPFTTYDPRDVNDVIIEGEDSFDWETDETEMEPEEPEEEEVEVLDETLYLPIVVR